MPAALVARLDAIKVAKRASLKSDHGWLAQKVGRLGRDRRTFVGPSSEIPYDVRCLDGRLVW